MSALRRSLFLFAFEIALLAVYTPGSKYSFDDIKYVYQVALYLMFCLYTSIKYYKSSRNQERQEDILSKYRKVSSSLN